MVMQRGDNRREVPYASFSRLSATNVVFGLTWPQLIVVCLGLVLFVFGCVLGFNLVMIVVGVGLMIFGFLRWEGLSLMDRVWIWRRWRRRLRDGETTWAYRPLKRGRVEGVLGLWGHVEERAEPIEMRGPEVVGTGFGDACYLFDPDKRQATAVLTAKVEEWSLTPNVERTSRAMGLSNLIADLADINGFKELKETAFILPGPRPQEPDLTNVADPDGWMAQDQRELYMLPSIASPLRNLNYICASVDADRLQGGDRREDVERVAVGDALGRLCRDTIGPALLQCGARRDSVRWCSVDDLRRLIHDVADQGTQHDASFTLERDDPTVTWCEESKDGTYLTLDSCVARTYWILQWPDRPVPAGFIRSLLANNRSMAFCHIWRPKSMEESERDLRKKEQSIEQRSKLQDQRKKSHDERREEKEQRQRELEQEANWPDTDHQGFVTLFAPGLDELEEFDRDFRAKARTWKIKLTLMRGQQREGLTTVLPLGI
ncbi:PrgI family protein [Bifidobacterium rousetti]|uniref:PrgI family protein n=1 Tax=Bifidobacterium rousetti TaxID=2045439 RepID=UPI001238F874|nr:PrgI family protein [Bifidobacterium rousetti]KAA8818359.1 PrgI family protein [Bifidobacterium rousetti]